MRRSFLYNLAAATILAFAGPSYAGEIGIDVVFTDSEASIIRAYYRDHVEPHHRKKKPNKGLPPGIAKNLQRGKRLPPGIAKQALPPGLIDRLPPPPNGFERIVLSGKVLLVEIATQAIHDVLDDIVFGK